MISLLISQRSTSVVEMALETIPKAVQRLGWIATSTLALTLGVAEIALAEPESHSVEAAQTVEAASVLSQSARQTPVVSGVVVAPPAAPTPAPTSFSPQVSGILDLSRGTDAVMSLGHLRPRDLEALGDDDVDWLKSVILPLYMSPGGEHWGWIYRGWLIPKGQTYLAIGRDAGFAMVRSYQNLYTFPVLEAREDGWFRVQYTSGGSAWAHSSQLALSEIPLMVEGWETRLQANSSVYFLEKREAQALRSQPELSTSNMLGWVPSQSLIEPLNFRGDWMQVRVTRPASNCRALAGATVTEGWMRWRGEASETLAWYRPDGGCAQGG